MPLYIHFGIQKFDKEYKNMQKPYFLFHHCCSLCILLDLNPKFYRRFQILLQKIVVSQLSSQQSPSSSSAKIDFSI